MQSRLIRRTGTESHSHRGRSGRAGLVVAIALLGVVLFFAWRGARSEPDLGGMSIEERYEVDDRIVPLIGPCAFGAPFEADTTDLAQILSSKLDEGAQLDPQRRAKSDLAKMGDEAFEPLMRLFQRSSKQQWHEGVARNVLTVCSLADGDWGVPIALEALRSPRETLRADGCIVLEQHPSPAHFDAVQSVLGGFTLQVNIERCLRALHACDPSRFALEIPAWIESANEIDGYIQSPVLDTACPLAARIDDAQAAEVLATAAESSASLLIRHRMFLLAPLARQGDAQARQTLTDMLAHELRKPRFYACEALAAAGFVDDSYVVAVTSEDSAERGEVLERIFKAELQAPRSDEQQREVVDWARRALLDEEEAVREKALHWLLEQGDDEGRSTLMTLLRGSVQERGVGMRAMRGALDDEPEIADQARALLVAEWQRELDGSRRASELSNVLQALGAVPGRATGDFLLEAGDQIGPNQIGGLSAFRWCVGQAFNAGPEARGAIRDRLRVESDPFKRLDLIDFVWQDFDTETGEIAPESLEILIEIIEDETLSPYERLYAADRSVRIGESERVLPILKRVYRGSTNSILRPGLHCLLWIWFGPPLT